MEPGRNAKVIAECGAVISLGAMYVHCGELGDVEAGNVHRFVRIKVGKELVVSFGEAHV